MVGQCITDYSGQLELCAALLFMDKNGADVKQVDRVHSQYYIIVNMLVACTVTNLSAVTSLWVSKNMLIHYEFSLCREVNAKRESVEVRLASGRETSVPHPAIWVHMLRCCDDFCDREEGIMCVANT